MAIYVHIFDMFNCSTKRTKVIDDEADFFVTTQWMSKEEKEAIEQRENSLRETKFASRFGLARKVTFDFAGRRITEDKQKIGQKVLYVCRSS